MQIYETSFSYIFLSCANFVKRASSCIHPIHNFAIFVRCKTYSIAYEKSTKDTIIYKSIFCFIFLLTFTALLWQLWL